MRVHEIFYSIQGEGLYAGVPTGFIRLQGCNLRCEWCDTLYAQSHADGDEKSVMQVSMETAKLSDMMQWVCITGGEPLTQAVPLYELVKALQHVDYQIEIETNGSYPPPEWHRRVESWCVDMKCPSSGMEENNREEWFRTSSKNQIKFVVASEKDLSYADAVLGRHPNALPTILISPMIRMLNVSPTGKPDYMIAGTWLQRCVEFVKERNLRLSLQIHKFIWPPEKRGV